MGVGNSAPATKLHVSGAVRAGDGAWAPTSNSPGGRTTTQIEAGRAAGGTNPKDAVAIFGKLTNFAGTPLDGVNSTLFSYVRKSTNSSRNAITAGFFEAQDDVGGSVGLPDGNFVEGSRSHGTLAEGTDLGAAYGSVSVAGIDLNAVGYRYLIGHEAEVRNNLATGAGTIFDKNNFAASFVATSAGIGTPDAGFVTNPFNVSPYREGFLVAEDSVSNAAFRSRATTVIGRDLAQGTQSWAAVTIPNETPLRARNSAETTDLNVMYVSQYDDLILGYQAGTVGIGSDAQFPNHTHKLHVGGSALATSWNIPSARSLKHDIDVVEPERYRDMLATLGSVDLATYRYRGEVKRDGSKRLGFIAEDLPREVLSTDGNSVDLYELLTYSIGALKAQQEQIEHQASALADLKAELEIVRAQAQQSQSARLASAPPGARSSE